jgi:hypothetical protein
MLLHHVHLQQPGRAGSLVHRHPLALALRRKHDGPSRSPRPTQPSESLHKMPNPFADLTFRGPKPALPTIDYRLLTTLMFPLNVSA